MYATDVPPSRDPRPTPIWPVSNGYSSQVDLPIVAEDDAPDSRDRQDRDDTSASPTGSPPIQGGGEVAKLVGGGSASIVVLALIDAALKNTGISAADVAGHLGPMLGALYNTYPVVAILLVVLVYMLRSYRYDQEEHRRRDRRLQRALNSFGRGIKTEIEGLRSDVAGFTVALDSVKSHVETRIAEEVRAVARVTETSIVELRGGIAELRTRMATVESLDRVDRPQNSDDTGGVPNQARRIRKGTGR